MRARFIGNDSLGYINGQTYTLDVGESPFSKKIHLVRPYFCPYDSWETFWMNWEIVTAAPGQGWGR